MEVYLSLATYESLQRLLSSQNAALANPSVGKVGKITYHVLRRTVQP